MKIECYDCGKLIDAKDTIATQTGMTQGFGTEAVSVMIKIRCKTCYNKAKKGDSR